MKAKILIVDDQAELRRGLKSILETNFTVTEADSGAALKKLLGGAAVGFRHGEIGFEDGLQPPAKLRLVVHN